MPQMFEAGHKPSASDHHCAKSRGTVFKTDKLKKNCNGRLNSLRQLADQSRRTLFTSAQLIKTHKLGWRIFALAKILPAQSR
jgi:hypothetical protein